MDIIDKSELERIQALTAYHVLDTPAEASFDRLTRLASYICHMPIAMISFVDQERQWFKSAHGITLKQTSRDISFCQHAIKSDQAFIVNDTLADPLFCNNPLVTDAPHIRFYAGIPLTSPAGHALGTLCVMDHQPRQLDAQQLEALQVLAEQVMALLELRQNQSQLIATLTNQHYLTSQVGHILDSALDIICIIDADGRFIQVSTACAQVLGYTPGELIKMSCLDLIHPEDHAKSIEAIKYVMTGQPIRPFHNRYLSRSGKTLYMVWSAVWSEKEQHIFAVARDTTENRQLEEFTKKQDVILKKIAVGAALKEVLDSTILMLEEQIPGSLCSVVLTDKQARYLIDCIGENLPQAYKNKINGLETGPAAGSCGTAIYLRQNVIVDNIDTSPLWQDFRHLTEQHGLHACWSVPFYSSNHTILGSFAIYFHNPRKPSDNELNLLTACSSIAGIAVERGQSQEQLRLLQTCVSHLSDIVLITEAEPIDEPGPRIVFVNDAFEQRTGYSREEAIGNTPRMLQGPKTQRAALDKIRQSLEKWEPVRSELINYTKTGEEFWLELDIVPIADNKGTYTHWIAVERDITERKHAELELIRVNRSLLMLSACNERLIRATDETQLISDISKIIVEIGGYKVAWIGYLQDDMEKTITPVAHHGSIRHIEELQLSWSADKPNGQGPGGRAIRSKKPVICQDVEKDASFAPWMRTTQELGYRGLICLPLLFQEQVFGLVGLYSSDVLHITDDELDLLQGMVENLTFGIMSIRARLEKERIQSGVIKVAAGVSASTDSDFFQQLALNMIDALGADAGFVSRLLPGNPPVARVIAGICDGQTIDNIDYALKDTPCEDATNQEICIVNSDVTRHYPADTILQEMNAQAYVGSGLIDSSGAVIGLICVIYRKPLERSEFILSTLKIIAARASAELERQIAYSRIRDQASLLDKAQDAIVVRGMDKKILFWNKSAERLYGWTAEEALSGMVDDTMHENINTFEEAVQIVSAIGEWKCELLERRKDGSLFTVEAHWSLVRDEQGHPQSILAILTDISQRKVAENEIKYLAYYDELTKLPNRRLLLDRLKQQLLLNSRTLQQGALFLIDLDNFKTLNDALGHDIGDLLLQKVADCLTNCVREGDTVARLGGDEFVVMLGNLSTNKAEAVGQANQVAKKILHAFSQPFKLADYKHHSTPSIGIVLFGDDIESIESILKKADLAMYQAKAAGRNTMQFFNPEMQSVINRRIELEDDLRRGLDNNEFFLAYQPQVNINGSILGAEVLIRWRHAEIGLISPNEFIPIAEETGLILPIGHWVLKSACQQLASWAHSAKTSHLSIAVNVSARQLRHASFVKDVLAVIRETGANPHNLKLELTESLLIDNIEDTIEKMVALKAAGVNFSLDDFGTGYSSLIYLKRLPLEQLKIDQSFVRDILIDHNDATIATTIITLAQSLGHSVLAEGVETAEQRDFLASHGCFNYQGYFFSKPIAINEFEAYIENAMAASI